MKWLEKRWYSSQAPILLLPLEGLFRLLVMLRRFAFKWGLIPSYAVEVPVIVVGNISVGGTGKPPLVVWLVNLLQKAGYQPGIVLRGYAGKAKRWPQQVRPDSDPAMVGDEPVMLAQRCACPIIAAPDRVAAAKALLDHSNCNLIITDDGLQHYRLKRDVEIVVVDGERRFGNGHCLPAGPLREPRSRLDEVDFVIANGLAGCNEFAMSLEPAGLKSLENEALLQSFEGLAGQRVHALAGIGNPQRFFQLLRNLGLEVIEHSFPDHHDYQMQDLDFSDSLPILMTEKDAVKCRRFANRKMWYVPVNACLPESLALRLLARLKKLAS